VLLALGGPTAGDDRRGAADSAPGGRAVFARMGCGGCHRLAAGAGTGTVGPDLDELLPGYDATSLRAKIVDPYPAGEPQYFATMPEDFGQRMRPPELDALVDFLLATARR
jgi:mono/diheme cytochrome c family protein